MNRYGDMFFFGGGGGYLIIPTAGMDVQGLLLHSRRITKGNHESVCDRE